MSRTPRVDLETSLPLFRSTHTMLASVLFWLLCSCGCAVENRVRRSLLNEHESQGNQKQTLQPIVFNIDHEGRYNYTQGNETWLLGAPLFLSTDGQNFTTENGSMKLGLSYKQEGLDKVGQWNSTCFQYLAGSRNFETCIKSWVNPQLPITVFQQRFVGGTARSSSGNTQGVISGFPSFQVPSDPTNLAYLSFQGTMFGSDYKIGRWQTQTVRLAGALENGPMAVFDRNGTVIIISAFSGFMSGSCSLDSQSRVSWGIMSGVDSVPVGYQYETIVYWGYQGINQAFADWGRFMRSYYDKDGRYRQSNLTLNYLGYWTDGGAYYYYATEPEKNYEQTLFDIKSYADAIQVPYRYIQYDSWFYPKGPRQGVLTWTPMPEVAPDGFQYVFNKTQWPVAAHNRWWSPLTPYAKQNGGNFTFIVEKEYAVPQDLSFWTYLFEQARTWGLIVYEQDWMDTVSVRLHASVSSVHVVRTWLMQMGEGARVLDMTIQYCSANPRQGLQSLEIPTVTQARASRDYRAGGDQWMIGVTSIFAHALGVAPFKDSFWTGRDQPGNRYNLSEPNGELQAAVATLSTGPVGPGDMIGHTDVAMLMQCCRADGKILQPDKPAMAIDKQIWQSAWPGSGPVGQVWSTYSTIGTSHTFGIILAAAINDSFNLSPSDAGFDFFAPRVVMTRRTNDSAMVLFPFSSAYPLSISQDCTRGNFCLFYTSPIYKVLVTQQVIIYGEEGKFVPMSRDRVQNIDIFPDSIELTLQGSAGEVVTLGYVWNDVYCRVSVTLAAEGKSVARLTAVSCPAQ